MAKPSKGKKETPLDYCDGCRRTSGTTICGLCLQCAIPVIAQRRKIFSRSEGNVYFSRRLGLPNYFKTEEARR